MRFIGENFMNVLPSSPVAESIEGYVISFHKFSNLFVTHLFEVKSHICKLITNMLNFVIGK